MTLLKISVLATSFLIASAANAQEYQFGAHGGANIPVGDLADAVDDRSGITLGGHVGIYYGNGHEIRPRVDFTHYRGGSVPVSGGGVDKHKLTAWQLGVDYIYYTMQQPTGLYVTGGLGYQWWDVNSRVADDDDNSAVALAVGAGWRFNPNFMLEGRYTTSEFQDGNDGDANAFQALASWRF